MATLEELDDLVLLEEQRDKINLTIEQVNTNTSIVDNVQDLLDSNSGLLEGLLEVLVVKNDLTATMPKSVAGTVSDAGSFGQGSVYPTVGNGTVTLVSAKSFKSGLQYLVTVDMTFVDMDIDAGSTSSYIYNITTQDSDTPVITLSGVIHKGAVEGDETVHVKGPKSVSGTFVWGPASDGPLTIKMTPEDTSGVLNVTVRINRYNSLDSEPVYPLGTTSVIFDIADNWGDEFYTMIRSIEFYKDDVLIDTDDNPFTAYTTSSVDSDFSPDNVFDTSLSKVGNQNSAAWESESGNNTNQRLIVVFIPAIEFDKIVINNGHNSGLLTDRGAKNVAITHSTDAIIDTMYGAGISNGTVLNNTEWPEHIEEDVEDDYAAWPGVQQDIKSVIFDIADNWGSTTYVGIRSIEFYFEGVLIEVTSGKIDAYATTTNPYISTTDGELIETPTEGDPIEAETADGALIPEMIDGKTLLSQYWPRFAFITGLSKTGVAVQQAWLSEGTYVTDQRLMVVFNSPITFDKIVINNWTYWSTSGVGGFTTYGARNVAITTSTDEITDITYDADIANSTPLITSEWPRHASEDVIDDQTVWEA